MKHQLPNIGPRLTYLDRPEIAETFADGLETVIFDGMSVRMEFVVNRFESTNADASPKGKKVTASRLVLPLAGAVGLISQLNALMSALKDQGALNDVTLVQTSGDVN